MTLTMLGVKAIPLGTDPENRFLPSTAECEKLITPRTKAIVLVTPNNPVSYISSVYDTYLTQVISRRLVLYTLHHL